MTKTRAELAVTLLLIAAVGVGLLLTRQIDLAFSSELETFSGPRAYPGLILGILMILLCGAGLQLIQEPVTNKFPVFSAATWRSCALFVALCVFVVLFERVGYILTIIPLLVFVAQLCGARHILDSVVASVLLSALCLLIFRYGLSTVLPEGVLGIDALL